MSLLDSRSDGWATYYVQATSQFLGTKLIIIIISLKLINITLNLKKMKNGPESEFEVQVQLELSSLFKFDSLNLEFELVESDDIGLISRSSDSTSIQIPGPIMMIMIM